MGNNPVADAEIEIGTRAGNYLFGATPHFFDNDLLRHAALDGRINRSLKHLVVVDQPINNR